METVAEIVESFARGDTMEALSETGRFLYVYNSTTLIASVGAIVGLILLGSLLWIAISASLSGGYGGGSYGGSYGGGYRKRRATEADTQEYSFLELLAMLDDTFRKLEINNFDCQKRSVCEANLRHAEGKVGPAARRIAYIFSKMDDKPLDALEPESADFLSDYFEAAHRGRNNENCAQLYPTCTRSLRDYVFKSPNSVH